jgi:hypothetical protein
MLATALLPSSPKKVDMTIAEKMLTKTCSMEITTLHGDRYMRLLDQRTQPWESVSLKVSKELIDHIHSV